MSTGVELINVARKRPEPRYLGTTVQPPHEVAQSRFQGDAHGGGNEYDFIKEAERSQRQLTENPIYGDHGSLPLKHPTLTADMKARDSAVSSTRLVESESPSSSAEGKGITCLGAGDCLVFVVLLFSLLAAIGALVLVLLLFVGAYDPNGQAQG